MRVEKSPPSRESCKELADFNVRFHEKHGYLPLDYDKGLYSVFTTCRDDSVFAARNAHGVIVGSIGLFVAEPWYSRAKILTNRWFNIEPGRYRDGACKALLEAAKREAARLEVKMLIITRWNTRKELKTGFGRIAEVVGYIPFGNEFRMRF